MIEVVNAFLSNAEQFFVTYKSLLGAGFGVLFIVSKIFSNASAPIFVKQCQVGFDFLANLFLKVGNLCLLISRFLADVLKSNGYLGKD